MRGERVRRRYFLRGVVVAGILAVCIAAASLILMGSSYNGKCGGFFPGSSAPKPCSLMEYMFGDVVAISLILLGSFWPVLLVLLSVPPLVGYLLDRRR
jgi:uncharacterized membrane protein YhaH (DUF805 family)